jgi:hypothetical protein
MANKVPICPYGHPSRRQPPVVILAISNHSQQRRFGGFAMKPGVTPGVDVHCTECHYEGWSSVGSEWNLDSWEGPRQCSCGVTTELP